MSAQEVTGPPGDENAKATAEVIRIENSWLDALTSANVDAIAEILADDFLRPAPDSGGFVNKKDLLNFYRSHLSAHSPNKKHMEDLTVTVYGLAALARGRLITTDSRGQLISTLLFTDVFVKRKEKWQAVSAQENTVTASVGKTH